MHSLKRFLEKNSNLSFKDKRVCFNLEKADYIYGRYEDNDVRLHANNIRHVKHSIETVLETYHRYAIGNEWISDPAAYRIYHKETLLNHYAQAGDKLCLAVNSWLAEFESGRRDEILESLDLPERILHRTLDETTYWGMLEGVFPIAMVCGKDYTLPKSKKSDVKSDLPTGASIK